MTVATFTPAQVAEMTNPFWSIDLGSVTLDDGTVVELGNLLDDQITEIPLDVLVGILAEQEDGSYACAHPALTDEDATLLRMVLDERAQQMATIAALPAAGRPAARTALRTSIRTAARVEARRDARRAQRVALRRSERAEDRRAARVAWRQALRQQAVDAGLITDPEPDPEP